MRAARGGSSMRTKPLTPLWPERRVGPDDMVLAVVACPRIRSSVHGSSHQRITPDRPLRAATFWNQRNWTTAGTMARVLRYPGDETARTTGRPGRNERETDMTRRAVHRMPAAPRRRLSAGVAVLVAWVLLAHASFAGAQPAVGPAAETASASPQAPPPEQLPGPGSSVAGLPGLLRFQLSPKFLTGVPIGRFGNKDRDDPGGRRRLHGPRSPDPRLRRGGVRLPALWNGDPPPCAVSGRPRGDQRCRHHQQPLSGPTPSCVSSPPPAACGRMPRGSSGSATCTRTRRSTSALDIGLRYLTGGEVDYLTRGELQRNENGVTFEPTRSPATLFALQIGIAVDF